MMKNELDNKQVLAAYERIIQRGEETDEGKFYQGITALSDVDGYTIYLQGSGAELRFGFHNTYHIDYEHEKLRDDFLKKLQNIANES